MVVPTLVDSEHRCRDHIGILAAVAQALGQHPDYSRCRLLVVAVPGAGASRLSL